MGGFLESWQERRHLKRTRDEARHAVGECRRILKKRGYLVPEGATKELELHMQAVESAAKRDDLDLLREALVGLDERMTKHLAFARKSAIREYAESIGVAVGIAIFLRAFVVEAFQIPSGSMIPTLQVGDHIFVAKFSYGVTVPFTDKKLLDFGNPERGDVIVFKYPNDPSIDYIKRVVGLPGDTVEVRNDQIFINGQPVPREHQPGACQPEEDRPFYARECNLWVERLGNRIHDTIFYGEGQSYPAKPVPEGMVFVMGDNRDNSNDSRVWGFVPVEYIKGRALIVWWSRGPTAQDGLGGWFNAIRWRRFFTAIH